MLGLVDFAGELPRDLRKLVQAARRGRLQLKVETTALQGFGDETDKLHQQLAGVRNQVVVALLPSIMDLVKSAQTWIAANRQLVTDALIGAGRVLLGVVKGLAVALKIAAEVMAFFGRHATFLKILLIALAGVSAILATAVTIAFPRSPLVTAQLAWDLQQLSGGRFQLGLGTQVRSHVERRYGARWDGAPGPRMREYVACLKAMFDAFDEGAAARPSFEGEHYRFTRLQPFFNPGPIANPRIPIYIAAGGPQVAKYAGRAGDGFICTSGKGEELYKDKLIPAMREGAEAEGRAAGAGGCG